ncbi:LysR family transcriptional regulator [soil metagenome]
MLDVKRLRILGEVAKHGSFSAAADALYLSQSAVSQQIATLEREVGMNLLERTREGTKLTDAGQVLVTHAEAAIARLGEAERELAAIAGLEGGEVRIASFPSASATLLTRALSAYVASHPKVKLTVADAEPEASLPRLRSGDLDVAVTFDYPQFPEPAERDVEHTLLLTESMHVALPVDHPHADLPAVPLADLADEDWLSGGCPSSCGMILQYACRDAGFEPRIGFESDDYHVLQGFIAAGLGVTLLPDLALPTLRSDIVVKPTEPATPMRRVWAATRRTRSPATAAMLECLVESGARFAEQAEATLEAVT